MHLDLIVGSLICFEDFNMLIGDEEKSGGGKGNFLTPNCSEENLFGFGMVATVALGFTGNQFN